MKKKVLLILLLTGFYNAWAQSDCATDVLEITDNGLISTPNNFIDGTYVPGCYDDVFDSNGGPLHGFWYKFTPLENGEVHLTSNLPENVLTNVTDTRVSVFTGDCTNLSCYQKNDDESTTVYLSTLTFPVQNGITYYIQWDNYWDDSGFDFDFTFTPVSCLKVYNISQATNLTDTAATLNWQAALDSPESYDIEYGTAGFVQGNGTVVNSVTNSITLNGLVSGTIYDYYIRSHCNATSYSDWSVAYHLAVAKTCPYYSGFDNETEVSGWTFSGNINGTYGYGTIASQAQSPSQFWIFNTASTGAVNNWLYSPPIALQEGESVTVSFWNRCLTSRNLQLTVGSDNTAANQTTIIWSNNSLLNTSYAQITAPSWVAPSAGIYYFAFNDISAAASTSTMRIDTINFSSTILGVTQQQNTNIVVYPNPVKDKLFVTNTDDFVINSMEIIDLDGRSIKFLPMKSYGDGFLVDDLARGVYLLKLNAEQGVFFKKIIKE